MAIRKIARMGHPVLKKVSDEIADPTDPEIARLARDLMDTCEDVGGNGIAAPQVYEPVRMFAYRVRESVIPQGARMQPIPWTVCINPTIEPLGEEKGLFWERCLSLPGLYGQAPRYLRIRFAWTDMQGARHAIVAHRYHARLLQHEHDHLDGILYPMRMVDAGTLGYVSELGPEVYPNLPQDPADFLDPEPA
jgi:peptide deformylase